MAGDDYKNVIGGKLKIKGAKDDRVSKKHKKNKAKPAEDRDDAVPESATKDYESKPEDRTNGEPNSLSTKTAAEKRFEESKRKRLEERARREGYKTHQERVQEFNNKLAKQTDHNDMPKIGPG